MLAVLLLSVGVGLWRGLVFELLSLAGWVLACWLAWHHGPDVAAWLPDSSVRAPWLRQLAGMLLVFLGVLIATSLAARLLRALINATPLSLPDRALGAVFGLARGLLVLVVLVAVLAVTPLAQRPFWQESQGVRLLKGWSLSLQLGWAAPSFQNIDPARSAHEAERAPHRAQAS